jgi:hypothetical protein
MRFTQRPPWSWSSGSWIYNYLCNQSISPLKSSVWFPIMVRCTLCEKVCHSLAAGQWFSPGTPVSFTNKTDFYGCNIDVNNHSSNPFSSLHRNKSEVEVWSIVIKLHRNKGDVEVWSIVIELHRNKSDVYVGYIVIEQSRNKSEVEVWSIVIEQSRNESDVEVWSIVIELHRNKSDVQPLEVALTNVHG